MIRKKEMDYQILLSRGGSAIPSTELTNYVCRRFAVFDCYFHLVDQYKLTAQFVAEHLPDSSLKLEYFAYTSHENPGHFIANREMANTFFRNK